MIKRMVPLGLMTVAAAGLALATPEYGRKTGKECNYCHPPNNFQLNDAGKYYRSHNKSLKGYVPNPQPNSDASGKSAPSTPQKQGH